MGVIRIIFHGFQILIGKLFLNCISSRRLVQHSREDSSAGTILLLASLAIMMLSGLVSNLCCRWLVQRVSVFNIFGGAMIIFAACLIGFPLALGSVALIYALAAALGVGSGAVTVIFFAGFADLFGKRHLGKIQGVAQAMTVASSGTGPLFFARSFESSGSYSPVFFTLAPSRCLSAFGHWANRDRSGFERFDCIGQAESVAC